MKLVMLLSILMSSSAFAQGSSGHGGSLPYFVSNGKTRSVLPADLAATCEKIGIGEDAEVIRTGALDRAEKELIATLPADIKNGKPAEIIKDINYYSDRLMHALPNKIHNDPVMNPDNLRIVISNHQDYLKQVIQIYDWYADYERRIYQNTFVDAIGGFSPETIQTRVREIAGQLSAEVALEKDFPDSFKRQVSNTFKTLEVITATSIAKHLHEANNDADLMLDAFIESLAFNLTCGERYEQINAFATQLPLSSSFEKNEKGKWQLKTNPELHPKLILCPGLVTIAAPLRDKTHALDFAIAHDLSHFIVPANAALQVAESSFLSCVDQQYGSQFRTLMDVVHGLEPVVREIQKNRDEAQALGQAVSAMVMGIFAYQAEEGAYYVAQADLEAFRKVTGRDPTGIESHATELLADEWAARVIAPQVAAEAEHTPVEIAVGNTLPLLCSLPPVVKTLENGDEGTHPPLLFRIENFLRHSSLRQALKRSTVLKRPKGKWCR